MDYFYMQNLEKEIYTSNNNYLKNINNIDSLRNKYISLENDTNKIYIYSSKCCENNLINIMNEIIFDTKKSSNGYYYLNYNEAELKPNISQDTFHNLYLKNVNFNIKEITQIEFAIVSKNAHF